MLQTKISYFKFRDFIIDVIKKINMVTKIEKSANVEFFSLGFVSFWNEECSQSWRERGAF